MDSTGLPTFPSLEGIDSPSSSNTTQNQLEQNPTNHTWSENFQLDEVPFEPKQNDCTFNEKDVTDVPTSGENSRNTENDRLNTNNTLLNEVTRNNEELTTLPSGSLQHNTSRATHPDLGNNTSSSIQNDAFSTIQSRALSDTSEDFQFPEHSTPRISNNNSYVLPHSTDFNVPNSGFFQYSTPTSYRSNQNNQNIFESPGYFEISDSSFSHTSTPSHNYTYHPQETYISDEDSAVNPAQDFSQLSSSVELTPLDHLYDMKPDTNPSEIRKQKRRREETPDQIAQRPIQPTNSSINGQVIDLTDDTDILDVVPHPTPNKRQRNSQTSPRSSYHQNDLNHFFASNSSPVIQTSVQKKQPVIVDLTILDSDDESPSSNSTQSLYRAPFNSDNTGFHRPPSFSQFAQYSALHPSLSTSSGTSRDAFHGEEVCYGMIRCLVVTSRRVIQGPSNPQVIEIDDDDDEDENKLVVYRDLSNRQDPTSIKVNHKKGRELGYLERSSANGLAPLIDARLVRVEGYLPRFRGKSNAFVTAINVFLYGQKDAAQIVGNGLHSFGLHVSEPQDYVPSRTYMNPFNKQALLPQSIAPSQTPVDTLYQWLETPIDLPELEPDARLIPKLYKHQKQALYFLTEREKATKANHESGKFSYSLYKLLDGKYGREQVVYKHLITDDETYDKPTEPRGGLLADDMGLGKTISIIALILSTHSRTKETQDYFSENDASERDSQDSDDDFQPSRTSDERDLALPKRIHSVPPIEGSCGGDLDDAPVQSQATLIICPLSVVANWEEQFSLHVKKNTLSVYVYHGNNRNTNPRVLAKYDVVITTYNVLALEYSRSDKHGTKSPLQEVQWLRIVLDEAHVIKDNSTIQSKAACNLSAERRWCLSGTPVQNKIDDLYSLVKFLQIPQLCEFPVWQQIFTRPLKNNDNRAVLRLQTLMKCITLRRVKTQECDGKPILTLPPKRDIFAWLEFSEPEQKLYDLVATEAKEKVNKMLDAANPLRQYMNVLQWILKLRQICAHHGLCDTSILNLEVKNDTQLKDKAGLLLSILRDSGDDKCQFCFQEVGEMPYLTKCEHIFCLSCATNLILNDFKKGKTQRFCPSCGFTLLKRDVVQVRGEVPDESAQPCNIRPGLPAQSTKIQALIKALQTPTTHGDQPKPCKENRNGKIKSVVFSQWTSMLDMIEDALKENNIQFARLDGKMNRVQRSLNIEKFRDNPQVTVILVSLKAGGVGLNLTSAQRVFLMDPYWNPAVENQAIDRVHRLGQKFPVEAVRFMMKNSIEEKIYALQMKKVRLTQMTFREKPENTTPQQRLDDIRFLFE